MSAPAVTREQLAVIAAALSAIGPNVAVRLSHASDEIHAALVGMGGKSLVVPHKHGAEFDLAEIDIGGVEFTAYSGLREVQS